MPNYIEYQKSVAAEFNALKNRVRNIIDNHHWGEDGRFKEVILMNYLKRVLPNNFSVGTGFVKSADNITTQIDIIVYDNKYPTLFAEGDFVIVVPESVIGIIEVKSNIDNKKELREAIIKANKNGFIICGNKDRLIYNGIFSFDYKKTGSTIKNAIKSVDYSKIIQKEWNQCVSNRVKSCVNHIALSEKFFTKLFFDDDIHAIDYVNYRIFKSPDDLAFSYFISNLLECIIRYSTENYLGTFSESYKKMLYPLEEGKNPHMEHIVYLSQCVG